jgi:acetate kinase
MHVLVINCGSSSLKADIINTKNKKTIAALNAERLPEQPHIVLNQSPPTPQRGDFTKEITYTGALDFEAVLRFSLEQLKQANPDIKIDAIGHRVVHGGDKYTQPILITNEVEQAIEHLFGIAPLHNPANLAGIRVCKQIFKDTAQVAVFDTAFHQTIPNRAKHYAIDKNIADKYQIKRYGFHGTSHKYVGEKAAEYFKTDIKQLRIISCHLGNGASVCAVEFGRSAETSMGMTPLEGLVMGTRCGDIDSGIILALMQQHGFSVDDMDNLLNKQSGLSGMSGVGNDMRDILKQAEAGNENCRMALQVFTHRLTKYIGAYAAVMGGVDILLFTGGIGENAAEIRKRVCNKLNFIGIVLDDDRNRFEKLSEEKDVIELQDETSRVKIIAVQTNEELAIALDTEKIIEEKNRVNCVSKIPVAVSARHVHLCKKTLEKLFGEGYELTEYKPLSQPGQYAANETVTLIGPKNKIENVRILGPLRANDQVEISRTDEFFLGIDAPIRESGNTAGSPGIILEGAKGTVQINEGVIQAWRHIHMHPTDAEMFGVRDKDIVSVDIEGAERPLTFKNVLIRVSDAFKLEMHIDTDEGNAAEIKSGQSGVLELCGIKGQLQERKV